MRYYSAITPSRILLGLLGAAIIFSLPGMSAGAENSSPNQTQPSPPSPPVFQPGEIQHGFSEFDSLPEFDEPIPYEEYSQSAEIPPADHKPGGLFLRLNFAKGVEEDEGIRRGHVYFPVNPTDTFSQNARSVYLVFTVHEHLTSYQIIGRLFHEKEKDENSTQWIDEDIVDLATEDESGYLKFFPPDGAWQPGRYRVDLYVGYMANSANKMGTMQFAIHPSSKSSSAP